VTGYWFVVAVWLAFGIRSSWNAHDGNWKVLGRVALLLALFVIIGIRLEQIAARLSRIP
jgi:hypothetical protein